MAKTKRKRSNPGILEWITDFFVAPIKNAITGLLKESLKDVTKEKFEELDAQREAIPVVGSTDLPEWVDLPKVTTPDAAYTVAEKVGSEADAAWSANMIDTAVYESLGLGLVDMPANHLWSWPLLRAKLSMGEEKATAEWREGVYPFLRRYWLKEYTPLLPGYADMIGVYVREGYLAEKWVEIPAEFATYMKELGYSDFWTKRLWGKHWVLPGVELLYDMFHKKIIDYDTLALMLKFHDFEPVWRDRLIKNAYALIPRVDLRRAYMYRISGYEDLVEPYEKLGYSPEDAATMDTIAKRFALTRYYTRLETVARAAFRKGKLTEAELREILVKVNTPEAAISLIIEAEAMARAGAVRDVAEEPSIPGRTDMRWLVEWGLIGLPDLTGLLEADGMDPEWAPWVAEAWILNQLRDELGKVRGVYEDLLEEGFISKPDFEAALYSLHFAPHVVDALVRWADAKLDLDEKLELAKEYETLAKEEIITVDAYGQALRKLGMIETMITRKQNHIKLLLEIKAAKEAAKTKG